MRKFFALIVLFGISLALGVAILSSLGNFIKVSDFKNFAEGKIGNLLKARVHVNEVKVGFLDQISLRGLRINQQIKNKVFYLLDIDKVVFKYNLGRFWQRDFKNPNTVFLDSPQFVFQSLASPFGFLHIDQFIKEGSRLTDELAFRDGKVSLNLPVYQLHFDLHKIQGRLKKVEPERWHVELEGQIEKLLQGSVSLDGFVDFARKQSAVRVFLNHLSSTDEAKLPIKDVCGVIRLSNEEIQIENLTLQYSRLPLRFKGFIRHFDTTSPDLDLTLSIDEEEVKTVFQVKGSLGNSSLDGKIRFSGADIPVHGKFAMNQQGFSLEDLQIGDFLGSQGEFDFGEKTFHLYLEHENQRIDLGFNLESWHIDSWSEVDHIPFFGADLVCRFRFELKPDQILWKENQWAFDGNLKTEYLILDQTPFPDFQGEFHVVPGKMDRIAFYWGRGYELRGFMVLKPPFTLETKIYLRQINLNEITSVFSKPLPENFKGIADGEVKIRGENWKAEVEGEIAVSNGSIGHFDYDRVSLHFYGIPPYLKLKDSRLKKGMRTFYLEGGIDLSKENVFQDIRVASSERILVWSGRELSRNAIGKDSP